MNIEKLNSQAKLLNQFDSKYKESFNKLSKLLLNDKLSIDDINKFRIQIEEESNDLFKKMKVVFYNHWNNE